MRLLGRWCFFRAFLLKPLGASWGFGGRLGNVLGALGTVLGASWPLLEASWGRLGRSRKRLGDVLGRPGASWERLGDVLGHPGGVSGAIRRQTDEKA